MSIAHYLQLRAELMQVRSHAPDSPDEDRLLGEMDDEWWSLSDADQREIRKLLAAKGSVNSGALAQSPILVQHIFTRPGTWMSAVSSIAGTLLRYAPPVAVSSQP